MAQSVAIHDLQIYQGTAATSGGTFTADFAIPTDKAVKVRATVIASHATAGHLDGAGSGVTEAVFQNKNGTVTLPAAISGSANPCASATASFVGSAAQAWDAGIWSGGVPTSNWSVSTTNGRCTFTNTGASVTVNVTIYVEAWVVGST